jgi:hypothetical protein
MRLGEIEKSIVHNVEIMSDILVQREVFLRIKDFMFHWYLEETMQKIVCA